MGISIRLWGTGAGVEPVCAPDSAILSADIAVTPAISPAALRSAFEHTIAAQVLAEAYSGADPAYSASLAATAERLLGELLLSLPRQQVVKIPRITPHLY